MRSDTKIRRLLRLHASPDRVAAAAVLVTVLPACSIFGPRACTDELVTQVDPRTRTVQVGATYTATASAWTCGGKERLPDEWRYYAEDSTIARVDSITGRVTARAAGATAIRARGRTYGEALRPGQVTVTP